MPSIMLDIIPGIHTPGNAGFAQPDAGGSPLAEVVWTCVVPGAYANTVSTTKIN
jgi:hypothetical protein